MILMRVVTLSRTRGGRLPNSASRPSIAEADRELLLVGLDVDVGGAAAVGLDQDPVDEADHRPVRAAARERARGRSPRAPPAPARRPSRRRRGCRGRSDARRTRCRRDRASPVAGGRPRRPRAPLPGRRPARTSFGLRRRGAAMRAGDRALGGHDRLHPQAGPELDRVDREDVRGVGHRQRGGSRPWRDSGTTQWRLAVLARHERQHLGRHLERVEVVHRPAGRTASPPGRCDLPLGQVAERHEHRAEAARRSSSVARAPRRSCAG